MASYCINALCEERVNHAQNATTCSSCGAALLINNRYRLVKALRDGNNQSQQSVYEGLDTLSGESVIVKVVEVFSRNCPNLLKCEQKVLSLFPITLYPQRITPEHYFEIQPSPGVEGLIASILILPKIDGIDSEHWIEENGSIDQDQAIVWLKQLLPFLRRLSEIAFLHRDIKPSNIIVGNDNSLTLIDYGAARKQDDEYMAIISGQVVDSKNNKYRKITRVVSAGYTAPEQNQGKPIPQSDYFSLGRTVMYWISGTSPTDLIDLDTNQIDWSRLQSPHKFDRCFLAFLERLTHQNPARRPLTLDDIEVFLETRLPELVKIEHMQNSAWSVLLGKLTIMFGIIGVFAIGWWGMSRFFYHQGNLSLGSKDYKRAIQEFQISRTMTPWSIESLRKKGFACIGLQNWDCAKKTYQEVLQRKPNDPAALYQLGYVYEEVNEITKARNFYQRSIEAQPIQIESHLRLARLEIESEKYALAEDNLDQIERNMESHPDNILSTDQGLSSYYQGWLNLERRNYEDAQFHLRKALEFLPPDSSISVAPGDIYCLLAQTQTKTKQPLNVLMGTWSGCFAGVTRTREGIKIRDQKIQRTLKNSLE